MVHIELGGAQVPVVRTGNVLGLVPLEGNILQPGDVLPMEHLELGGCKTAVYLGPTEMTGEDVPSTPVLSSASHIGRLVLGADIIGTLRDGSPVYMQHSHSHASTHLEADKDLWNSVPQALARVAAPKQPRLNTEVRFDECVGWDELVRLRPSDRPFYATRPNRDVLIPFVEGRALVASRYVTLWLNTIIPARHRQPGLYELFSAWTGRKTPPLPTSEPGRKNPRSIPFWSKHALVPRQEYDPATRTDKRPW